MELPLTPSPDTGYSLLLERGPLAGQRFRVKYRICDNPVCQCEHVTLDCYSEVNAPSESGFSSPMRLEMDLSRRAIANMEELKADFAAFSLAKAVEWEISETQWAELRGFYLAVKQQQTEEADLNRVEVQFPPEVLKGDTSMVGYYEMFPYAPPIVVTLESIPWFLDDQYCVNPTCRCREAALSFLRGHSIYATPDAGCNDAGISVRYAYDKGQITAPLASKTSGPSARDLLHLLKGAQENLDASLAERHLLLRKLFRRALPKATVRAPSKTPGRNDPCPCGSGKKYKRCCGIT